MACYRTGQPTCPFCGASPCLHYMCPGYVDPEYAPPEPPSEGWDEWGDYYDPRDDESDLADIP